MHGRVIKSVFHLFSLLISTKETKQEEMRVGTTFRSEMII